MSRLSGQVVATTRDGVPEDPLTQKLEAAGARVLVWPTLSFAPPEDEAPLRRARADLADGRYDWVAVTSARSVEPLGPAPAPCDVRVAAVGASTAAELARHGWPVDIVGDLDAAALVQAMATAGECVGARVLFPAASLAGDALEQGLLALGSRVDRVEAYRTVITPPDGDVVRADLDSGVGAVAFASPSAVRALADALRPDWPEALDGVGLAAIGPATAEALADCGVNGDRVVTAEPTSLDGLVDACVASIQQTKTRTR